MLSLSSSSAARRPPASPGGDTYRAVYTVRIAQSIHVLHAFQKKSTSEIKTPKTDVDMIERRLKAVLDRHSDDRK